MTTTELYWTWTLASNNNKVAQVKLANYYKKKFPNNTEVIERKDYYTMYLHLTL